MIESIDCRKLVRIPAVEPFWRRAPWTLAAHSWHTPEGYLSCSSTIFWGKFKSKARMKCNVSYEFSSSNPKTLASIQKPQFDKDKITSDYVKILSFKTSSNRSPSINHINMKLHLRLQKFRGNQVWQNLIVSSMISVYNSILKKISRALIGRVRKEARKIPRCHL